MCQFARRVIITAFGSVDSKAHHPRIDEEQLKLKTVALCYSSAANSFSVTKTKDKFRFVVKLMELSEAIKKRRSIRAFKKRDVPKEIIEKLIDAANWAPSAGNIQPWEFVIIRKQDIKEDLVKAADQAFVEEAPVVIVVCANEKRSSMGYGVRGKTLYCIQDTAAAIQNILLTAHSLGLGSCWIGAFNEDKTKKAVNAPEGIRPVAIIPVGYADETPSQRSRRPLNQIMYYENFN
jgi:nitroreductase